VRTLLALVLIPALGLAPLRADVTLAAVFSDHAVLQEGMPVPVWGRAAPGERVRVRFRGEAVGTSADPDGRWIAVLPPLEAAGVGADLVAEGDRSSAVRKDVVVGEVWFCSGQSNMEFTVDDPSRKAFRLLNAASEVAAARYPLIRQFEVARRPSASPADDTSGEWIPCSPATVGKFTAVGYFFARDLHRRLGVPFGIIDCTWGGTPIEAWMSPAALASDPAFSVVAERWRRSPPDYPHKPSWLPAGLFDGMVNPILPYALRGVLWYQGESNAVRAPEYRRLFASMIGAWRAHWGRADLPFYWVQLANYRDPADPGGTTWAALREAQAQALALPNTGMAVTIDIGDPRNIHPADKQEVGRRLALIAKARVYGITEEISGPVPAAFERAGGAFRIRFRDTAGGLTAADRPLQSFELAGQDRKFHPASAEISGDDDVVVRSPAVPDPVAVRYAWRNAPDANLFNGAGLPAAPFRSDDW
jgi:sialate O-acetylesterase